MVGGATNSVRNRYFVGATVLLATIGGAAFWAWRKRAPLARSYRRAKRRSREEGDERKPNPERKPGTDPV